MTSVVCHAVTRWVVLPTKCTRRYRVLSVMCFHTPTVRRAAHSIADGYETKTTKLLNFWSLI